MSEKMEVAATEAQASTAAAEKDPKPEGEGAKAEEKMDTAEAKEEVKKEDEGDKKVEQHTAVLMKGLRLILGQFSTFQQATEVSLPDDVLDLMRGVLERDDEMNNKTKKANGTSKGATAKEGGRNWTHARTAAMLERALANDVEGIVEKKGGIDMGGVNAKAVLSSPPPHYAMGVNFVKSQALDYQEDRSLDVILDDEKLLEPVELACKKEWFELPKDCQLDFGKAEGHPGMKIELGDPVKCGCNRETIQAYNKRSLFYKVLEHLTVDVDRLAAFFSILVESGKAELSKDDADLKARMKPIFDDLDDVCAMHCNRAAALFYLTCQNVRGVALEESGLRGFFKNWLRLAHSSKVLFEPGMTDEMNRAVKAGRKSMPASRGGGGGGPNKRGRPMSRGGGGGGGSGRGRGSGGGYGGKMARMDTRSTIGPYGGRR